MKSLCNGYYTGNGTPYFIRDNFRGANVLIVESKEYPGKKYKYKIKNNVAKIGKKANYNAEEYIYKAYKE